MGMYGNSETQMHSFGSSNSNNFNFANPNNNESSSKSFSFLQLCKSNNNNSPNTLNEEDNMHKNLLPKFSTIDSISPSDHEKSNDFNIENTNECLKNLHMIHEQNETNIHSSTSSSICSSESTTPRLNRSFIMLNRRTSLEDNEEQMRMYRNNAPIMPNGNSLSVNQNSFNFSNSVLQTPLNQYFSLAQATLNNLMASNHENNLDPNIYGLYRTPNNNNNSINVNSMHENDKLANTSQYLSLNRKAENKLAFSNENEPEAILN